MERTAGIVVHTIPNGDTIESGQAPRTFDNIIIESETRGMASRRQNADRISATPRWNVGQKSMACNCVNFDKGCQSSLDHRPPSHQIVDFGCISMTSVVAARICIKEGPRPSLAIRVDSSLARETSRVGTPLRIRVRHGVVSCRVSQHPQP